MAYPRVKIFVSLRMAASAEAPSSPMRLQPILQAKKGQDGNGERVRVSMGTNTKANSRELVREAGGLQEPSQRRVALEALCNRGTSFRAETVSPETASMGAEVGAEACQGALTGK